jgi:hypothetical protein
LSIPTEAAKDLISRVARLDDNIKAHGNTIHNLLKRVTIIEDKVGIEVIPVGKADSTSYAKYPIPEPILPAPSTLRTRLSRCESNENKNFENLNGLIRRISNIEKEVGIDVGEEEESVKQPMRNAVE